MLIPGGSANYPNKTAAAHSPLAARLFEVEGVTGIFIGADFFTVTKAEEVDWNAVNEGVAPALEAFFASGEPVLKGKAKKEAPMIGEGDADPETVQRIRDLIEEKVRPAVAQDGGDITFRGFDKGIVYLEMQGACSGCPSSSLTLKSGVESMLKYYVPEVQAVEQV